MSSNDDRKAALMRLADSLDRLADAGLDGDDLAVKVSYLSVWKRVEPAMRQAYAVLDAIPYEIRAPWLRTAGDLLLQTTTEARTSFNADALERAEEVAGVILRGSGVRAYTGPTN